MQSVGDHAGLSRSLSSRLPAARVLTAMNRQNHDLLVRYTEVDCVGKPLHDRPPRFPVDPGVRERVGEDSIDCLFQRRPELSPKPMPPVLVPVSRLDHLHLGFRAETDATRHSRSNSLRRTSSHGTAALRPSRCSFHRRSSSAAIAGLSASSASRSSAERLSHRSIASSARSPGGNFRSSERDGDDIRAIFASAAGFGKIHDRGPINFNPGRDRGPAGRRSRRRGRGGGWRSRTRWRCIARGVRPGETRMGVGAVGALAVAGAAVTRQDARRFPAGAGRAVEQDSEVSARIMPGADQHHRACHRQASASVIHRAGRGR